MEVGGNSREGPEVGEVDRDRQGGAVTGGMEVDRGEGNKGGGTYANGKTLLADRWGGKKEPEKGGKKRVKEKWGVRAREVSLLK